MNEARRKKLSENQRQIWLNCEQIAGWINTLTITTVSKFDVYNHLYTEILNSDLLSGALGGNRASIEKITELPGWKRMVAAREVKIHQPEQKKSDVLVGAKEKIGVAMWYLGRFATIEEAKKVLDLAIKVKEELE